MTGTFLCLPASLSLGEALALRRLETPTMNGGKMSQTPTNTPHRLASSTFLAPSAHLVQCFALE